MIKLLLHPFIFVTTVLLLLVGGAVYGDTHTSIVAAGNFNTGATWDQGNVPANGDQVIIQTGHVVTMTAGDQITDLTIEEGGQLIINVGRTLRVNDGITLNYGNGQLGALVSGAGRLRLRTAGTAKNIVNVGGAYGGPVTLSVATIWLNANITFNVEDDGVEANEDLLISGVIDDLAADRRLTKTGAGSMTLSGANIFSHDFRHYGGTVNLNNAQALGLGGATRCFDINGGLVIDNTSGAPITLTSLNRLRVYNSFTFTGTFDLDMGAGITQWRGNHTVTTFNAGVNLTFSGPVNDQGDNDNVIKAGAGTLTLGAANSMRKVVLNEGQLNINHIQALGDDLSAAGEFTINGGTIDNTSTGDIISVIAKRTQINASFVFIGSQNLSLGTGVVKIENDNTITVNAKSLTLNGVVADTGNDDDLIKDGAGTLVLTGTNTHQSTTLNSGTLEIKDAQALGNKTNAAGAFKINGGTLDNTSLLPMALAIDYQQVWGGDFIFTGSDNLDMGAGAVDLTADVALNCGANSLTVGGVINDGAQSLDKLGGGVLSFASQAVTLKDVTVSGGTLTPPTGAGILSVSGDFTNNGTLTVTTGKIDFNGAAAQTLSGVTTSTMHSVEVSGGGGVILNTPLIVSSLLTLTDGIVVGNQLLTIASTGTSNAGTATSYIDGVIRKYGASDIVFPIGDGAVWAPIELSNFTVGDASTMFEAKYNFFKHHRSSHRDTTVLKLRKVSKVEYWDLDQSAGLAPTVDVTLHWKSEARSGTALTGGAVSGDLVVGHYNGTDWESINQSAVTHGDPGSVSAAGVSSFSPFSIGSRSGSAGSAGEDADISLPVELIEFKVKKGQDGGHVVSWTTAAEINNDYFVVQRSVDGVYFEDIQVVIGQGNSVEVNFYSFVDLDSPDGNVYYRLKQIDFDKLEENSKIVQVENEITTFSIYPNPVINSGNVSVVNSNFENEGEGSFTVVLMDVNGRVITSIVSSSKLTLIPLSSVGVNPGHYFIRIVGPAISQTKKLIIE